VEHQLARAALEQLEQLAPDGPGFDAALTMVMAGIEHHVVEEETQALPRLVAQLGPDRLAALAQQLTAARSDLLDESGEIRHGTPKRKGRRAPTARPARQKRPAERTRTPRSKRTPSRVDPDQTTRADLIARARKAGISGYSHLSKEELAKALNRAG
jgi:hypothetical protein